MTNQPTPSAKEQVLAWVRERNPQTMELKDGCVVRYVYPHGQITMEGVFIGKSGHYGNSELWGLRVQNCVMPIPNKNHFEKSAQILGSDMGLQELLIAFMSIHGKNKVHVGWHLNCPFGAKDFFEGMFVFHIQHENGSVNLAFDLTKNLHNQEPEFYEALLPLLS